MFRFWQPVYQVNSHHNRKRHHSLYRILNIHHQDLHLRLRNRYKNLKFMIHRCELYADTGSDEARNLVSLEDLGEEIE